MIDWEDLAQRQIAEIQQTLPESIRARATQVPVFLSPTGNLPRPGPSFLMTWFSGRFRSHLMPKGFMRGAPRLDGSSFYRF